MTLAHPDTHGPSLTVASSELVAVTMCPCGILTVTLQSLSLRFDTEAFRELQRVLSQAQRRIDGDTKVTPPAPAAPPRDLPPMH